MTEWINECDFKPKAGEIYEEIGVAHYLGSKKYQKSPIKIYSLIQDYKSNISYRILSIDKHIDILWETRKPRQYRKLTDIKEIVKYKPMPKFDWSYC